MSEREYRYVAEYYTKCCDTKTTKNILYYSDGVCPHCGKPFSFHIDYHTKSIKYVKHREPVNIFGLNLGCRSVWIKESK